MNGNGSGSSPILYSMAFFDVQNLFRHAKDAFQGIPLEYVQYRIIAI